MTTKILLSAAFAGFMTAGMAATAMADDMAAAPAAAPTVKCYGIAKAGQNSCANASGSHSCSGQAKIDNDAGDFTLVAASADCDTAGGKTTAPDVVK